MMENLVRFFKGLCMGGMFGIFFMGILLILFVVLPANRMLNFLLGEEKRVEPFVRKGFGLWLRILGLFGLIRERPPRGKPYEGRCVVICNHPGLFDVLFLIKHIPRLSVMVKYSLSRTLPLAPILKALEYVLTPDYKKISPLDAAEEAIEKLESGRKLQLFPEGTRSPAGRLGHFKPGAFKIARITDVPVQPVFIDNRPPFLHKGERWYYPSREPSMLRLEFWEPIRPPARGDERAYARSLEKRYRQALGIERPP